MYIGKTGSEDNGPAGAESGKIASDKSEFPARRAEGGVLTGGAKYVGGPRYLSTFHSEFRWGGASEL